jgi:hypothetical protein
MRYSPGWSMAWVGATAVTFLLAQVLVVASLPTGTGVAALLYLSLVEFFVIGLACDLVAMALGIFVRPCPPPRRARLEGDSPAVALLCTTCDDVDPDTLQSIREQDYPNLATFVLDDSRGAEARALLDASGLTVVRRGTRRGYKAGNLNDWLRIHGNRFRYLVIVDADSRLPIDFVRELVLRAEHPENADVAFFESLIRPWNASTAFEASQGVLAPIYHRMALGLLNRAGAVLSAGHNNLVRSEALREIGGFAEEYLAEDQATSAEVVRRGWRCVVAPVASWERVPANLAEYVRRETRWAYQTFQLSRLRTRGLPFACTLRLLMSLHGHARPLGLLAAFAWMVAAGLAAWAEPAASAPTSAASGALGRWLGLALAPLAVQGLAGLALGVSLASQGRALLMHQALAVACAGSILRRLVTAAVRGDRQGFDRTGRAPRPDLLATLRLAGIGTALAWAALLAALPLCQYGLPAVHLLWLTPAAAAPLLLHRLHAGALP